MKTINLIIIIIISFLVVSCSDLLDKSPISSFSADGFYKTTSDAQTGVYGIYDAAQTAFRLNFAYWGEGRGDNVKQRNREKV